MATLGSMNSKEKNKDFYGNLFDASKLQAIRPSTKSVTIFRPLPQVAPDGTILPMVMGTGVNGLDFSNFSIENIIDGAGVSHKYTGFTRASDNPTASPVHQIFSGMFIRLRKRQKDNELPQGPLGVKIAQLLEKKVHGKSTVASSLLGKTTEYAMIQGIVVQYNGVQCTPVRIKQAILLPTTAAASMNKMLTEAHKAGIDVFNPDKGHLIVLEGLPPDMSEGRPVPVFKARLGDPMPIPVEKAKSLWVPWESAMKLQPTAWHVKEAIRCFGPDVVAYAFPEEFEQYGTSVAAAPATQPLNQQQRQLVSQPAAETVAAPPPAGPPATMAIPDEMPPPLEEQDEPETPAQVASTAKVPAAESPEARAARYKQLLQGL